ncbi:MAG: wax ester/triacylglycerol synthase family O-acyltransferase [Acidimicrobiia bacterium]|nr:wax ester/triacylglycerol synthase family O-acyltransferase [Acidimicrobiia bacterium]MBT8192666.1 wax ester/triacylglycerol synthase family O-acyltransferase [Acidimicrobiia bacterium]MBT8248262.1 wax ester/triacylglycerol synthase family O-acyltransferase [Acidimicrobiia bacterium]NNF86988.1 wax ester/triacylglycerol synthase family O-acyltransferase [Acidimicrobiia bacterium]NNJ46944.1 wax ester/triacylglycerol synthase family O-acyltransferase [Acidimicrobiia bacterium]
MHQLNGIDTTFLNMETPTQQGHVGGVVIVDPSTAPGEWGFATIRQLIEDRIHLLPPFRRRLVTVPLEVDNPYWVEDAHFDLDFHLRHIAVPSPGGRTELAELVARIHERPLDRSRPLWEMYVIEGLEQGRVATYTKLHHAAIDGVSGAEILTILLDPDPAGRPLDPSAGSWEGQAVPSPMSLLLRSAARTALSPARAMRVGYELARSIPGLNPLKSLPALVGLGRDRDEFLSRPTLIAPRSLLNRPITPHRRWVFGEVSLETVKAIKTAAGTTVNNVVISVSAGAVRSWMLEHGDLPDRSLQALIPISIRTDEEQGEIGNKVSGMIAPIGTHLADPIERLEFVHHTMEIARDTHQATPATMLQDFAEFAPPAIAARAARLAYRNGRGGRWTPFNLVISNVPGPHFPLYLAGAQLEGHYPVSAITDGAALNITLHSYLGQLCFGLVADRDLVPDLATILDSIHDEVAQLEGFLL